MQRKTEQQMRIEQLRMIVIIMVVLFLIILSYTIFWSIDYNSKFENYQTTRAEIVSQVEEDGVQKDIISYTIDNVEYRITVDDLNKKIGKKVTIFYNKDNPIDIELADSKMIALPILTGFFGTACIGLIIVYFLIYNSQKQKGSKVTPGDNQKVIKTEIVEPKSKTKQRTPKQK